MAINLKAHTKAQTIETAKKVVSRSELAAYAIATVAGTITAWEFNHAHTLLTAFVSLITIVFFIGFVHKAAAMTAAPAGKTTVDIKEMDRVYKRLSKKNALPKFTILIALFREGNKTILGRLTRSIHKMRYPKGLIQVIFVIPTGDTVTEDTLRAVGLKSYMTIFHAPKLSAGEPQTKPRDLNYALPFATGDYVCIFDAEDEPNENQLRAVVAASIADPSVMAFQCELRYRDADTNVSTRIAAAAYRSYFNWVLPGYVKLGLALPFGGTSNYFKKEALEVIGGWDGYNITEDCNLGIQFKRLGFKAVMLDGFETMEQPNDGALFSKVAKQWTRWQGGFLITAIVQTRRPVQLMREVGPLGFLHILMLGLTPVFGALIPIQLFLSALYYFGNLEISSFVGTAMQPTLPLAWSSFIGGNLLFICSFFLAARKMGINVSNSIITVLAMYALAPIVGWKALHRALLDPHTWGKTNH